MTSAEISESLGEALVHLRAINEVLSRLAATEPAQAVPEVERQKPFAYAAKNPRGFMTLWWPGEVARVSLDGCELIPLYASPPAGTAAPRLTEGHLPVARVIELLRECFIVTGENQFRNGRHFYRSLGHTDHVCEHDLINFARAIERALLAQGNQEGAAA